MRKLIVRIILKLLGKKLISQKQIRLQAFKGDNVHCICCGQSFITFLPFGLVKRSNAQCPNCFALERHRLHWHYMENKTNLFDSNSSLHLLHVAPESIFFTKFTNSKNITYVPCAKFGEGYEDKYPEGTIDVDLTAIQFPDNTFDVIYCSHVLEHIPDDAAAMKELHRVLKPGGWALLQVPLDVSRESTYEDFSITNPKEREKAFGQTDHVRVYGKDYKDRLANAGFRVHVDSYVRDFSKNDQFRFGFLADEDLYVCYKQ